MARKRPPRSPDPWAKKLLDEIGKLEEQLRDLEEEIRTKRNSLAAEVVRRGLPNAQTRAEFEWGFWECPSPKNALAECIYALGEGYIEEEYCLFCDQPRERK